MKSGLVRDWCLRVLCPLGGGKDVQFQCRLFRLVQALILGAPVASLAASSGFLLICLADWLAFCLAVLGHIIADCGIWAGRKCGHGLTSRPRETSDPAFLDSLLEVFGYPARSGRSVLAGDLPLRYYSGNFALRKPSWGLPEVGRSSCFDYCWWFSSGGEPDESWWLLD